MQPVPVRLSQDQRREAAARVAHIIAQLVSADVRLDWLGLDISRCALIAAWLEHSRLTRKVPYRDFATWQTMGDLLVTAHTYRANGRTTDAEFSQAAREVVADAMIPWRVSDHLRLDSLGLRDQARRKIAAKLETEHFCRPLPELNVLLWYVMGDIFRTVESYASPIGTG